MDDGREEINRRRAEGKETRVAEAVLSGKQGKGTEKSKRTAGSRSGKIPENVSGLLPPTVPESDYGGAGWMR